MNFDRICREESKPKVGIVGEIFLKFNPFSHKNITGWLVEQGIEVVPPVITGFFMQSFVNQKVKVESYMERGQFPEFVYSLGYKVVKRQIDRVNRIGSRFRYFIPFGDIFEEADEARKVVSLNAQFGEGWLLPAEVMSYARQGVKKCPRFATFRLYCQPYCRKRYRETCKKFFPGH